MPASSSDVPADGFDVPGYVGRFAPSPTGPLHAGSLVAALASWLDARAHRGRWLVRIEDVDTPRCVAGAQERILGQLAACGMLPDEEPVWQSRRGALYQAALEQLLAQGRAYPCACTRKEIEQSWAARGVSRVRHGELVYPGTCRPGQGGVGLRKPRAVRLLCQHGDGSDVVISWHDRRLGAQVQNVSQAVGDFVLRRADGLWPYQLAVVVDDADQGISDIVRGEDLADNTPRQRWLQQCLGAPAPRTLHVPLVRGADGAKLSKQHGAAAVDERRPLAALDAAARVLGLAPAQPHAAVGDWLAWAVAAWAARWGPAPTMA